MHTRGASAGRWAGEPAATWFKLYTGLHLMHLGVYPRKNVAMGTPSRSGKNPGQVIARPAGPWRSRAGCGCASEDTSTTPYNPMQAMDLCPQRRHGFKPLSDRRPRPAATEPILLCWKTKIKGMLPGLSRARSGHADARSARKDQSAVIWRAPTLGANCAINWGADPCLFAQVLDPFGISQ